jgi:hypothetical protein
VLIQFFPNFFPNKDLITIIIEQNKFKRWTHNSTAKSSLSVPSLIDDESPTTFASLANTALHRNPIPKKKLTDQLIAQGLLTKAMIEDLKREWKDE